MILSASDGATQQWAAVDLGDRRLIRRAVAMGAKIAAGPTASRPHQMGAYRLLNNPRGSLSKLLAPGGG